MASNPKQIKKDPAKPGTPGTAAQGANSAAAQGQSPLSVTLGQARPGPDGQQPNFARDMIMDDSDGGAAIVHAKPGEKNKLVENLEVHGDIPQARFGHTITIVAKQKVVLFGGATGDTGKYSMTGETFMFNILSKNWQKLQGKH